MASNLLNRATERCQNLSEIHEQSFSVQCMIERFVHAREYLTTINNYYGSTSFYNKKLDIFRVCILRSFDGLMLLK